MWNKTWNIDILESVKSYDLLYTKGNTFYICFLLFLDIFPFSPKDCIYDPLKSDKIVYTLSKLSIL